MIYWEPAQAYQHEEQLAHLMNIAGRGLEQEDQRVAASVRAGQRSQLPPMRHAFGRVGPGLSYWLYETTLVYLVWRSWVDSGVSAALDWSLAQLEAGERSGRKDRGKSYDLAVFCSERPFLFEAKSWSYYSPNAMAAALTKDARKLRNFTKAPFLKKPSKYILLFGHDNRDMKHNNMLCSTAGLRFAGRTLFPASTRKREDDHFVVTVFSVVS